MIQFECQCGKSYQVPEQYAGKKVRCKKCDTTVRIPGIQIETSTSSEKCNRIIHFKCFQCQHELEAPEAMVGKTILCHHCQSSVEVKEGQIETAKQEEQMPLKIKGETKSCPYCGEEILAIAKKCKHCREFLDDSKETHCPNLQSLSSPFRNSEAVAESDKVPKLFLALVIPPSLIILFLVSLPLLFPHKEEPVLVKLAKDITKGETSYEVELSLEKFKEALYSPDVTDIKRKKALPVIECAEKVIAIKKHGEDNVGELGMKEAFMTGGAIGMAEEDLEEAVEWFGGYFR